jgi:hypothetical protein
MAWTLLISAVLSLDYKISMAQIGNVLFIELPVSRTLPYCVSARLSEGS